MKRAPHTTAILSGLIIAGCGEAPEPAAGESSGISDGATDGSGGSGDGADDGDGADGAADGDSDGFPDDGAGPGDGGDPVEVCQVPDGELDAPICTDSAAPTPMGFAPAIKWVFDSVDCYDYGERDASELIVANLTDDNGDGSIDLCDTPDIAMTCRLNGETSGVALIALDGATGDVVLELERLDVYPEGDKNGKDVPGVDRDSLYHAYPEVAAVDVNGDGAAELVWSYHRQSHTDGNYEELRVIEAVDGSGSAAWTTEVPDNYYYYGGGVAAADLNGDGHPSVLVNGHAIDHTGQLQWTVTLATNYEGHHSPIATDLDDDGHLEVIWGSAVYDHQGQLQTTLATEFQDDNYWGWNVAVADLDENGTPELIVDSRQYDGEAGFADHHVIGVLSADGELMTQTVVLGDADYHPNGWDGWYSGSESLSVSDVDGDGDVEVTVATGRLGVAVLDLSASGELVEQMHTQHFADWPDNHEWWWSSHGSVTSFDFLGTGQSQIIRSGYGVAVYSPEGELLFDYDVPTDINAGYGWWSDSSAVVADIDNDGSAEFVVRTNGEGPASDGGAWHVAVFEEPSGGWTGARRIWNQSTYHVTNVREDGRIATGQPPAWKAHNTFRVQSTSDPSDCAPPPTEPEG